ncbi:MAG: hypothetical protein QF824_04580 [Candidatus Woesearchaeota archaeon]|jgi:membrane protein YdbS with pleckstrin-like domain|nr:hypothetical protein [Candidatus Woesearchaeota archaeon]|tara:strand:+ start:225 stop:458 length:234 start_codon:yes stop_codon:yes gene_type:complete
MDPTKRVRVVRTWTRIISYISATIGIGITSYKSYQNEGFTFTNLIVTLVTIIIMIFIIESVIRWFLKNAEWNPENKN